MTSIVVHGIPGSPYTRVPMLALEEKGGAYKIAAIAPGQHKQPPYLALHPFGRVPVLEHDGWMLYETQAILRYLDVVFPEPRLQPKDTRQTARMNQLMGIADWYVLPQVTGPITFQRNVAPRLGIPVDEAKLAAALPNARICIAEIERLMGDHQWLAADTITLADLMLAPQLSGFAQTPEGRDILQAHEKITGCLARMEARPSMQATTPEQLMARVKAAA